MKWVTVGAVKGTTTYTGADIGRVLNKLKQGRVFNRQRNVLPESPKYPAATMVFHFLGKEPLDEKLRNQHDRIIELLNANFEKNNIKIQVVKKYGEDIIHNAAFVMTYGSNSSYILLAGNDRRMTVAQEANDKGWEKIYDEGNGFQKNHGTAFDQDFSILNIERTKTKQKLHNSAYHDSYSNAAERLAGHIQHEHVHQIYGMGHIDELSLKFKETGKTILYPGPPDVSRDYSTDMIKALRTFYGTLHD